MQYLILSIPLMILVLALWGIRYDDNGRIK